jgi:two-component system sensor histidine kinase/response regulator
LEIITGNLKNRRGAVLQIRDITKLIRAEEAHREKAMLLAQLEENFKKLKETEQTRDNLLHMIVHDMKNPLQIIMGYMELLKRQLNIEEDETVERCVRETLGHSSQLVQMVNSLLDIGRLEAGEMPLELEMQDLTGLVRNAIGSVAVLADGRRVSFHPPAEALPVYADANIIQRVTLNLIGNAIKHTPEGTPVSVMVESRGEEAWVGVADSGPGIPPDQHENLFRKFGRVRHSNGKKNGASTGIGLAFCKLAVEAHRGRIGVNSEVGQGSMFWFSLPLVPAPVRRPVCRV